jgi:acyl carrier protein
MSSEAQRREIFDLLVAKMVEMFELEAESITLETHLFKDLDLDSIDAIDLAVQLQEYTGRKVEEESLRGLRTMSDVVDLVVALKAVERS